MMKTSTKVASLVVVLAVAGLLYSNRTGPATRTTEEPSSVTVVVSWTPSPRLPHGTEVRVAIDNKPVMDPETPQTAPFSRSFPIKRGQRVDVWTSLLGTGDGWLGCNVKTNTGVEIDAEGGNTRPGRVLHCWGTA